jgi:hypothetical protein
MLLALEVTSFNSNGFTLRNISAIKMTGLIDYASWTFRKAKKFFDVVTYTGDGTDGQETVAHNLGSAPGMYYCKEIRQASSTYWPVYHGCIPAFAGFLNATDAFDTSNT